MVGKWIEKHANANVKTKGTSVQIVKHVQSAHVTDMEFLTRKHVLAYVKFHSDQVLIALRVTCWNAGKMDILTPQIANVNAMVAGQA